MKTRRRYRIVADCYLGYEVQYKTWWWPFWIQAGVVNTWKTIEDAENYAKQHGGNRKVIKEL